MVHDAAAAAAAAACSQVLLRWTAESSSTRAVGSGLGASLAAGKGLKKETKLGLSVRKSEDFAAWYPEAIVAGEFISYYDVSGARAPGTCCPTALETAPLHSRAAPNAMHASVGPPLPASNG